MRKSIYLIVFISSTLFSQEYTSRDGVPLSQIKSKYIIVDKPKVFNKKTYVYLNHGQELKTGFAANAIRLNGSKEKFSSILNVINLLNNYDVVQFIDTESSYVAILKYLGGE